LQREYVPQAGAEELLAARERLMREAGVTPDDNTPLHLDQHYLGKNSLQFRNLIDITKSNAISGRCIGMVGSVLVVEQDSLQYTLPLSKLTGYRCTLSYNELANKSEPHQVRLF
jgi:hypothetical protein